MEPTERVALVLGAALGPPVVAGSTPVVSFGDPTRARVATIGINPSRLEFQDRSGRLLTGPHRRLATMQSLRAIEGRPLHPVQVRQVLHDCATYFQRNPYRRWFDPLDEILQRGVQSSHYDGTACHLDLTPWATDPIWGKLTDPAAKARLLADGLPLLVEQVEQNDFEMLVVNGAAVWNELARVGLVDPTTVARFPFGERDATAHLVTGSLRGTQVVGWTLNIQSSHGVRAVDRVRLADWLQTR